MSVIDFTDINRVVFLENDLDKEQCLKILTETSKDCLYDSNSFYSKILEREELLSTGMGLETAFPHSKNSSVIDFFVTIGISQSGVNWQAIDEKPVKIIFLIGGLIEEQEKYLKILAAISKVVGKEKNRNLLLGSSNRDEFYEQFCNSAMKENQAI
ncbi:MAG: PTS sugar transporter subunit IIA [Lentisphaeraceae bacterium]|nr:PTS sugar transporter subunit IIA [Lentisphaeraceae bacterium]